MWCFRGLCAGVMSFLIHLVSCCRPCVRSLPPPPPPPPTLIFVIYEPCWVGRRTCHFFCSGILGGGAVGVREGIAKAPNRRSRVLLNSVMNHAGKKGSFYGNTFAVLGERMKGCLQGTRSERGRNRNSESERWRRREPRFSPPRAW